MSASTFLMEVESVGSSEIGGNGCCRLIIEVGGIYSLPGVGGGGSAGGRGVLTASTTVAGAGLKVTFTRLSGARGGGGGLGLGLDGTIG